MTACPSLVPSAAVEVLYESDRATVVLGDARDVLPTIEKESIALVVADPPYGKNWRSNRRAETFDELVNDGVDDRTGIREVLAESVRIVGQNRHLSSSPAAARARQSSTPPPGSARLAWPPSSRAAAPCASRSTRSGRASVSSASSRAEDLAALGAQL